MQRAELDAELERLVQEAATARANLTEILVRIKALKQALDSRAQAAAVLVDLHSA